MPSNKVRVIAELGCSHNGDIQLAKDLSACAVEAGADYVKWQFIHPERLALLRSNPKCSTLPFFTPESWSKVLKTIPFEKRMLTIYESWSAIIGVLLDVPYCKISHVESRNRKLVEFATHLYSEMFVSYSEHFMFNDFGISNVNMLGVCSSYPCALEEAKASVNWCRSLDNIGYSDHTGDNLDAAYYALEQGCPIIEIHVRMDEKHECIDKAVSKTVKQLAEFCKEAHK